MLRITTIQGIIMQEQAQTRKFTDDELIAAMKLGVSNSAFAREVGCGESCVRARKKKLIHQGLSPEHDMTHTVPDGYKVKGVSSYYGQDGELKGQWVKSAEDKERQLEILTEMCNGFLTELPKLKPQVINESISINANLLAVYPLGDPHIGMKAWKEESGSEWNLAIAEEVFCSAFDRVVKTAPSCNECLIVNLGDYFHRDNAAGITTRSHAVLDCDGSYAQMVQMGVKIKRQMITTALSHHKLVRVIILPGNHDDVSSLFLSIALKHIYENEPRVVIDDSPSLFHYHQFGKVLIGAHHGHTCKMQDLPGVMASDKYKEWGTTEFRYWLTGHIHHDSMKEYPGCKVESFRTLAAKDSYATNGGWRSGQDTKCIVYHKEWGEVERHVVNIAQLLPLKRE